MDVSNRNIARSLALTAALLGLPPGSGADAATHRVPQDEPTIQLGIDAAAAGDTILVACGTYQEAEILIETDIVLISATETPDCVTIDALGQGSVIVINDVGSACLIRGFTITNGSAGRGGGIAMSGASPRIERCEIRGNGGTFGAGIACVASSSPAINNCLIASNLSNNSGGGIYCSSLSSPVITGCTIAENSAYFGGGIFAGINCDPVLIRSIVAFSADGVAVHCEASATASLSCCDLFGNFDGDWSSDCVAGQAGGSDNFSADPEFCGVSGSGNYWLQSDSPCAAGISPCGMRVGARDTHCAETAAEPSSWSRLKSLY
jgi:hypothetical protein